MNNKAKITAAIWATLISLSLPSCDRTLYVAISNYKAPCKVVVTYQRQGNTFIDSDTLMLKGLNSKTFDSALVRVNTSANTYFFMAPQNKEIALNPTGFGVLIKQIDIFNSADLIWTINLKDNNEREKLKASGQIMSRPYSLIVNNK